MISQDDQSGLHIDKVAYIFGNIMGLSPEKTVLHRTDAHEFDVCHGFLNFMEDNFFFHFLFII